MFSAKLSSDVLEVQLMKKINISSNVLLLAGLALFAVFFHEYLSYVFWFLVMITAVVFVHEFGHFIVARWCGVQVEVFSIGFGKEIFGWNDKYNTRWKVCWLPFGGYVKMFGDADPASAPDFKKLDALKPEDKNKSFYFKKLWQKSLVVFAGPAANYILAILIMTMMFAIHGKQETSNEITLIAKDSPAEKAGLQIGDLIVEIDGNTIRTFDDARRIITLNVGEPMKIRVDRNGTSMEVIAIPEIKETKDIFGNVIKMPRLGLGASKITFREMNLITSISEAIQESYKLSVAMLKTVGQMITGARSIDDLGGPVKIAKYSGQSAQLGQTAFMWFVALISLNLGLVNLFPIPMLDGGHLMYYFIEKLTGRPVSMKVQLLGFRLGFVLIIMLMVMVTFNDIRTMLFK